MRNDFDWQVSPASGHGGMGLPVRRTRGSAAPARSIAPRLLLAALSATFALLASSTVGVSQSEPITDEQPARGPDVVYQWGQGAGDGIYVMSADGSESRAILGDLGQSSYHPDWSPDGSRIAFELEGENGWDIWTAAPDGSDRLLLVDHTDCPTEDCIGVSNPAWSPDGEALAYARFHVAPGDVVSSAIEVMEIATGVTRVVASSPPRTILEYPRWSPDATSIVYAYTRFSTDTVDLGTETGSGLAVVDTVAVDSEPRDLTDPALFASYPDARASDGLIVFTTYDLGEFQGTDEPSNLYTIMADGSGLTQLTNFGPGEQRATQPTWTPDGEHIIFTLVEHAPGFDQPRRAAFIDANGEGLHFLDPSATHPRLRPDGTRDR